MIRLGLDVWEGKTQKSAIFIISHHIQCTDYLYVLSFILTLIAWFDIIFARSLHGKVIFPLPFPYQSMEEKHQKAHI